MTGKTETLARSTREAVLDRGRRVAIASLTNTAAAEIRSRTALQDRGHVRVGTLHRLCMDLLGVSAEGLVVSHVADWNERAPVPSWRLTPSRRSAEEAAWGEEKGATQGDVWIELAEGLRHRELPRSLWPPTGRFLEFWQAFSAWKTERGLLDFTDLIEEALRVASEASRIELGGDFRVDTVVIDECQDLTPLEASLVRRGFSPHVERTVMAGDADQALYSFRGADSRIFLDFPADGGRHVLARSHRVPRAICKEAADVIRRIRDREDVTYEPRNAEGEVRRVPWSCRDPEALGVDRLLAWMAEGSVMFLAATQYQLGGLLAWLRSEGLPFANPWTPRRGDWNPMRAKSSARKLLAFTDPKAGEWTHRDLLEWMPLLRAGGLLRRGVAASLGERFPKDDRPFANDAFATCFLDEEDALAALERSPGWLLDHALQARRRPLEYLARVHARGGRELLEEEPRITIGTVHSVKGATADTVVVFPDVTFRMWKAQNDPEEMDAQTRTFYVAMTRARERLVLAAPGGRLFYPL